MQKIFRFAFEELARRGLQVDAEPLNKSQILKTLFSNYTETVDELMARRSKEIAAEYDKGD